MCERVISGDTGIAYVDVRAIDCKKRGEHASKSVADRQARAAARLNLLVLELERRCEQVRCKEEPFGDRGNLSLIPAGARSSCGSANSVTRTITGRCCHDPAGVRLGESDDRRLRANCDDPVPRVRIPLPFVGIRGHESIAAGDNQRAGNPRVVSTNRNPIAALGDYKESETRNRMTKRAGLACDCHDDSCEHAPAWVSLARRGYLGGGSRAHQREAATEADHDASCASHRYPSPFSRFRTAEGNFTHWRWRSLSSRSFCRDVLEYEPCAKIKSRRPPQASKVKSARIVMR